MLSIHRKSILIRMILVLALIAAVSAAIPAFASPNISYVESDAAGTADGDLDPTFGSNGIVTTDFNNGDDNGTSVVLQPDGRIILGGATYLGMYPDFVLARYMPDGSLDASFDGDGKVITDFAGGDGGYAIALQADGRILLAGSVEFYAFELARYNSDGSLDATFGGNGIVTTAFGQDVNGDGLAVAVQPDGKIVMAGHLWTITDSDFLLVRYNTDGSLDTGFGVDGIVTTDFGAYASGEGLVIQPTDGKIIFGGHAGPSIALARYNSDGSLDTTFDADGRVIMNVGTNDFVVDLALQPDGKILAVGSGKNGNGDQDFVLVRYNANGSMDTTFDADGKVMTDFGSEEDGRAVAVQPDGRIIMTGAGSNRSTLVLARYQSNGSLDPTFGVEGKIVTQPGYVLVGYDVVLQPDHNIIVAGMSYDGSMLDFAVARYIGDTTPRIRYVKSNANGANNGTSWADAYTDLQSALAAASSGDEIWVAAGTYKPTTGSDRSISFNLHNGVAIYGGFTGTETSLAQRDPVAHPTILSGDIGTPNDNSDNSYHVVAGSGTNNSAILDGFTVTEGNANGSSSNDKGGGMYTYQGAPIIRSVTFGNNSATFGGGMYNGGDSGVPDSGSSPVLTNVVFNGNTASEGGGMENQFYSSPTLTNVSFSSNTAVRSGGGMLNYEQSSPSLTDVTFAGNTASAGGGMFNWAGDQPTLERVTFTGNSAQFGGGMGNDSSNPTLHNVIFNDNTVTIYGGGMSNDNQSSPTLANVTFSGNKAYDVLAETYGGGITNQLDSAPILTNVTFYNNSATHGGGMLNRDPGSAPVLTNVTFNSNTAAVEGGSIANDGNMIVRNGIFWGNNGGEIFDLGRGIPNVTYSIVQGGYAGTGNLNFDPLLGSLANNGGFTKTIAIGANSPAVDAGDDAHCPATDQRGVTRPQGSHCDIGAYEYETVMTVTPSFTPTYTPTNTPTMTATFTPTFTPTSTVPPTKTFTPTASLTASSTLTFTTTFTPSSTFTPTATPTATKKTGPAKATSTPTLGSTSVPTKTPTKKKSTFADVSSNHPYYNDIEILYANGLTGGCSTNPLSFCPDQIMNRGQAAVLMLRGNLGNNFAPDTPTHAFQDDWSRGTWAEPWAEAMLKEGLSAGCLTSPLKYCPWDQIPREQAVIFALRLKYGINYVPPAATGTLFADMTNVNYYATPWAEQAYKDGLIQACGTSGGKPKFCPANLVSRGLAAYMIVRAKNLTMP